MSWMESQWLAGRTTMSGHTALYVTHGYAVCMNELGLIRIQNQAQDTLVPISLHLSEKSNSLQ